MVSPIGVSAAQTTLRGIWSAAIKPGMQARTRGPTRATRPARTAACAAALWLAAAAPFAALGQSGPNFYAGKQIRMIIGHPAGNDYDLAARFLAKYLVRHIPGEPTIIAQNMPQAASITAANFLFSQAPRDGTVLGSFSRNVPSQARMGQANVSADPRLFNWLGATSLPSRVCVASATAPVKTAADLFTHELIVAGSGAGSSLSILPTVFNHVLGTKFRVIEGYKGTTEAVLAMERGEVQGVCATYGQFRTYEQLLRDGKIRFILRAEEAAIAELKEVPSIFDFAQTNEQRQLMRFVFSSVEFGRPYAVPPGTPQERVALLRKAFADTVHDPELIAEAEQLKLDMTYRSPEELERLVTNLYETPPEMVETVKKLVPGLQ
jgi:tripartite-type tricarboxylate transporter receptor subunit TctC